MGHWYVPKLTAAAFDPRIAVKANWGLWAVRGTRYDILGPQWE